MKEFNKQLNKKQKNVIYAFKYCSCIWESEFATISLHYTKKGATGAMKEHKKKKLEEYNKMCKDMEKLGRSKFVPEFGIMEAWHVGKVEILP
jgi:hypothetical protein